MIVSIVFILICVYCFSWFFSLFLSIMHVGVQVAHASHNASRGSFSCVVSFGMVFFVFVAKLGELYHLKQTFTRWRIFVPRL